MTVISPERIVGNADKHLIPMKTDGRARKLNSLDQRKRCFLEIKDEHISQLDT